MCGGTGLTPSVILSTEPGSSEGHQAVRYSISDTLAPLGTMGLAGYEA